MGDKPGFRSVLLAAASALDRGNDPSTLGREEQASTLRELERKLALLIPTDATQGGEGILAAALRESTNAVNPRKGEIEELLHQLKRSLVDALEGNLQANTAAPNRWSSTTQRVINDRKENVNNLLEIVRKAKEWKPRHGSLASKVFRLSTKPYYHHLMTINILVTGTAHGLMATSWARENKGFDVPLRIVDVFTLGFLTLDVAAYAYSFNWRIVLNGWTLFDLLSIVVR